MLSEQRIYSGSDAHMLQSAGLIYALFAADQPAFAAYSLRFGQPDFLPNYLAQIEAAESVAQDLSVIGENAVKTQQAAEAMRACRAIYRRVKSYVELTYRDTDPPIVRLFAHGYREAARSGALMVVFMEVLHQRVMEHLNDLMDANRGGMPATIPDRILLAKEQLQQRTAARESSLATRPVATSERLVTLNTCFRTMMLICNAAQQVFAHDQAKRRMYLFRPRHAGSSRPFRGAVKATETKVIATINYTAARKISFRNVGQPGLDFDLSIDGEAMHSAWMNLEGGARVTYTMGQLNDGLEEGTEVKLWVRNSGANTGFYRVILGSI